MTKPENPPEPPQLESLFEDLRSLPREPPRREMLAGLQWKAIVRGPIMLLLPLMLVFTLMPLFIFSAVNSSKANNQRVTGRAIQVETLSQNQIFVKYRFVVNGKNYTGASVGVGNSRLRNGEPLEISFDKAKPQNSAPVLQSAAEENFPLGAVFIFPLMAAFFFAPLFFPQMRLIFLARKLFTRGTLTTGRVRFVKTTPTQSPFMPGGSSQIVYEFFDSSGGLQRGVTKCDNIWLVQQFRPDSPVIIAFNSGKPAQNVVLETFVA
ncbi:MAG TPA: hypothetical protein VGB45_04725 [Abditibacterium sp.]|jgi:hypothetical protein